jgi:hypothetical protein
MHLIPGRHPAIHAENVRTLRQHGHPEHVAHAMAHAHAKATAGLVSGPDGETPAGHMTVEPNAPPHGGSDATESGEVDPKGRPPMIQPSHKGRLHKALGVPEGEPIPAATLEQAENSKNPHVRQMANFAEQAKGFAHPAKKS